MRKLLAAAVGCALMPAAAHAAAWVAICRGMDAQYTQVIGGAGYLHIGQGDGTYVTQRLNQSFYNGDVVCGANDAKSPQTSEHVAQVCADKVKHTISVIYQGKPQPLPPQDSDVYCPAIVKVH